MYETIMGWVQATPPRSLYPPPLRVPDMSTISRRCRQRYAHPTSNILATLDSVPVSKFFNNLVSDPDKITTWCDTTE